MSTSNFNEEMRSVRVIEVIEVVIARGRGTQDDMVREVYQYWEREGTKLAENDPSPRQTDTVREQILVQIGEVVGALKHDQILAAVIDMKNELGSLRAEGGK